MLTSKTCSKCGEDKALGEFYSGRSDCKACKRAAVRVYEHANTAIVRKRKTAWRIANPEATKEQWARWAAANPDKVRANRRTCSSRRRARKRGATPEMFTPSELYALWADADAWACTFCGAPWAHQEHFVPLARGGDHALGNIWPACAECNLSKSDRDPWEYLRSRGVPGV